MIEKHYSRIAWQEIAISATNVFKSPVIGNDVLEVEEDRADKGGGLEIDGDVTHLALCRFPVNLSDSHPFVKRRSQFTPRF